MFIVCLLLSVSIAKPEDKVPEIYQRIKIDSAGQLYAQDSLGTIVPLQIPSPKYTLKKIRTEPVGTDSGLIFNFDDTLMTGNIYFGLMPDPADVNHDYTIFRSAAKIKAGIAKVELLRRLKGLYDWSDWGDAGYMRLGYRIIDSDGMIVYDGKLIVTSDKSFAVDTSIIEGPFVNIITENSAVISFQTNRAAICSVTVGDKTFKDSTPLTQHEIQLDGLASDSRHDYKVHYGKHTDQHYLRTAPRPGSRTAFTFAYTSDGRSNYGGGERDIFGTNAYIMKRNVALCKIKDARFLQYTGDLIDGYTASVGELQLQYANWKRSAEAYTHYMPVVAGFGNHEGLYHIFKNESTSIWIDRFPFAQESAEVIFASNVVNPLNSLISEDGSSSDPNPNSTDFPPYAETVFHYVYDNVAMVNLNSVYLFSPTITRANQAGGNLKGYIMENQMKWLEATLKMLEADENIDHIFITSHCPIFPNGGHLRDDMWYNGNNAPRPIIAGQRADKGIIECRDELLDIIINGTKKVKAVLTGDEHNFCLMQVTGETPIYPEDWNGPRLKLNRPFWHINNGTAGAPYYGQESAIWSESIMKFSTQHVLVLMNVDGLNISVEVINPDTMEPVYKFEL